MKIFVAITGASGSIYARRLVERLARSERVERIWLSFTRYGREVFDTEEPDCRLEELDKVTLLREDDMFTPPASGSASTDAVVIVPCSMGMCSKVACGAADNLVSRTADVMLKERRKLIMVVRETPFNLIHLNNMTRLTEAGAVIMPASPSFYGKPETIEKLVDTVIDRIVAHLSLETAKGWCE